MKEYITHTVISKIVEIRDTSSSVDIDIYRYVFSFSGKGNLAIRQKILSSILGYLPPKKNCGIHHLYSVISDNLNHLERYIL